VQKIIRLRKFFESNIGPVWESRVPPEGNTGSTTGSRKRQQDVGRTARERENLSLVRGRTGTGTGTCAVAHLPACEGGSSPTGKRKRKRYEASSERMRRSRKKKQDAMEAGRNSLPLPPPFPMDKCYTCDEDTYKADSEGHRQNIIFEKLNRKITHRSCNDCQSVSLSLKVSKSRADGVVRCQSCIAWRKKNPDAGKVLPWLPVWYMDGVARYHIPEELACLREGEKLMIQMVSPYVPLRFLKGGAHGCKGHVCSFPQSVEEVVHELPRKKVEAIKVVRSAMNQAGETEDTIFRIRRSKVLDALRWLKKYNLVYKDICINETNLDWMEGSAEAELEVTVRDESGEQECQGRDRDGVDQSYGVINNDPYANTPGHSQKDLTEKLQEIAESAKDDTMRFPYVATEPCNEYDDSLKIFCMAFPWLYPGGRGDFNEYYDAKGRVGLDAWVKNMLYFRDGRFARDRAWCFFANNYAFRRKNQRAGNYYVKDFHKHGPQSLADLKEMVEKGDHSWISDICYYGSMVRGSVPYWRARRDEINSWIQYHVSAGNGAPAAFMTLSCAEFHWPDVKRLLKQRCSIAGDPRWKESEVNSTLVHEYTVVIQEYFQLRVKNWFETVGKKAFGIKHYWLRFEFAPGRGQIHAHTLLILDNMATQEHIYKMRREADSTIAADQYHASILEEWAKRHFAMTASIPSNTDLASDAPHGAKHPAAKTLSSLGENEYRQDAADLLRTCQNHMCTMYCMRQRKFL
jgi:hypothetical protein